MCEGAGDAHAPVFQTRRGRLPLHFRRAVPPRMRVLRRGLGRAPAGWPLGRILALFRFGRRHLPEKIAERGVGYGCLGGAGGETRGHTRDDGPEEFFRTIRPGSGIDHGVLSFLAPGRSR